ncbi:MAG: substrate-binding domain-containing protein, partial [Pseudomonadota bacterium]
MTSPNAPTLADVARQAGVSTATVSRCLNEPERVRRETRERVEAVVARLGYTPHFGARALASNRTNTVGAVIPTMENAIFALAIQTMERELSAAGVTLFVATSNYDAEREAEQIRALTGRGVDGLILIGRERPEATYRYLKERAARVVLVWASQAGAPHPCVGFDNRAAARSMAERVIARGHRRVAMIAGVTAGNDRATERVEGVRAALAAAGAPLAPDMLIETEYAAAASAEAAKRLMRAAAPPTAILCGNDVQAAGALKGLRALGLSVPGDVSVVGFDDIELASAVEPELTTVHVPHRRMGRAAAKAVLRLRNGGEP